MTLVDLSNSLFLSGVAFVVLTAGCSNQEQNRILRLTQTINDNPVMLHRDVTPSVQALVCEGKDAIPPMLELMVSGDETTRLRAQTVLREVTFTMYNSKRPQWKAFWEQMGNLDYKMSEEKRLASVSRWQAWLNKGCPGCPTPNARRSQGIY
jgi:hypothetical protein